MINGDEKNIDILIKESLAINEEPDLDITRDLKRQVRVKADEISEKGISIWWIPAFMAIFISLVTCTCIYFFMENRDVKNFLIVINIFNVISNVLVTFVGIKYFDLRKEAIISGR